MKRKIIASISSVAILFGIGYIAYDYNLIKENNVAFTGKLFEFDKNKQLKQERNLVNIKMQLKHNELLKEKDNIFEFFDKDNNQILEVKVYFDNGDFKYQLSPNYVHYPRDVNSHLELFCNDFNSICSFTFAFLDNETKYNVQNNIAYLTFNNKISPIKAIKSTNERKDIDFVKNIDINYSNDKIEICSKFSNIKYGETLRITTVDNGKQSQKVCSKENIEGTCCSLIGDNTKFSYINVLHWIGDNNSGEFTEYSFKLK